MLLCAESSRGCVRASLMDAPLRPRKASASSMNSRSPRRLRSAQSNISCSCCTAPPAQRRHVAAGHDRIVQARRARQPLGRHAFARACGGWHARAVDVQASQFFFEHSAQADLSVART